MMRATQTAAAPSAPLATDAALSEYDLVSALAHEVRGALAIMDVSLNLLDDRQVWKSGVAPRLVQRVRRSVTWITGLVENTRWAAAEVDASALDLRPMLLLEPIESAVALVSPLLELKRQVVKLDRPNRGPWVHGDCLRLTQVVVNLLTNASAYGSRGDSIEVDVSVVSGRSRVQVTDHGPGVAPHELEHIFQRHVRGSAAAERRVPGLGLGLYLAKTLVEFHAGTIGVESVLGGGARFWFDLPCLQTAQREQTHNIRRNGS